MKNIFMKTRLLVGSGVVLVIAITLVLYWFLPVSFTIYAQPDKGNLRPADTISTATPLEQCIDGTFAAVNSLDILLGTYNRQNTNMNHFEIFTFENGQKKVLFKEDFSSAKVEDNDYFAFIFPPMDIAGKFCFLLTSSDAGNTNGITLWLNSQSEPVLKLTSTMPLHEAVKKMGMENRFHLPQIAVVALCLLYLASNIAMVILLLALYAKKTAIPKPAHPSRAGKKRI